MSLSIQFRTVLVRDGLVELLADEVAGTTSNADCEAAVRCRIMVFDVGDEGWGVAHACDVRICVPDAAVSLVVEGRGGFCGGGRIVA